MLRWKSSAVAWYRRARAASPFAVSVGVEPGVKGQAGEGQCSSHGHAVSGWFGRLMPASLPRCVATRRATPGLMVGSTLDGGPDWADGAITRGGRLVAREVDGGVVVPLVPGPALLA